MSTHDFIARRAQEIYYKTRVRSYYLAVRIALNEARLKLALAAQAAVCITFKKKSDGTLRTAIVTTKEHLMPVEIKPKGTGHPYTSFQIRFVDTTIGEWRSCRIENIVAIHW